jgi:hypothetical protein
MSTPMPQERRAAPRVCFEEDVEVRREQASGASAAKANDLSTSGIGLEVFTSVGEGESIHCRLPANTKPIEVTGEVAWVTDSDSEGPASVGIRFRQITRSGELRLRRLVEGLVPQPAFPTQTSAIAREIVLDPDVFSDEFFAEVDTEQRRRYERQKLFDKLWWAVVVLAGALTIAAVLLFILR